MDYQINKYLIFYYEKKHKILSIGHRNQQGLFYDKENDIIFSTDHGPLGGHEIDLN